MPVFQESGGLPMALDHDNERVDAHEEEMSRATNSEAMAR